MAQEQMHINESDLMGAVNAGLNACFYDASREGSKQIFNAINDGQQVQFIRMSATNGNEIHCDISLDSSLYDGKLNFSKFRRSLAVMMLAIQQRIDAEESLNMLTSEAGDIMFNVPGIVKSGDVINILVAGFRQLGSGKGLVRLMYLEPNNYIETAQRSREQNSDDSSTQT